jgi:hypothetical protein
MPQLEVTTTVSNQVWTSPDGQRKIYELTLDYNGQPVKAKTYSDAIATVGWSGTVESYEKIGKQGAETFVKQPPKEGGYTPSQQGSRPSGYGATKFENSQFTMYLSYAKDLAVAVITAHGSLDVDVYKTALKATVEGGNALYSQRPDAPKPEKDVVHEVPDEPVDLSKLQTMLGDVTNVDEEETPWPNPTS